jgi:hypothetical protein
MDGGSHPSPSCPCRAPVVEVVVIHDADTLTPEWGRLKGKIAADPPELGGCDPPELQQVFRRRCYRSRGSGGRVIQGGYLRGSFRIQWDQDRTPEIVSGPRIQSSQIPTRRQS